MDFLLECLRGWQSRATICLTLVLGIASAVQGMALEKQQWDQRVLVLPWKHGLTASVAPDVEECPEYGQVRAVVTNRSDQDATVPRLEVKAYRSNEVEALGESNPKLDWYVASGRRVSGCIAAPFLSRSSEGALHYSAFVWDDAGLTTGLDGRTRAPPLPAI